MGGACDLWINIGGYTIIQRNTPANLLGRGASLIAVINYRILLIGIAVVIMIAFFILSRGGDTAVVSDEYQVAQDA